MSRVVQISFHSDAQGRAPAELLQAWPTLVDVAEAAALGGSEVSVVQASTQRGALIRNGVAYHFLPFEPAALQGLLARLRPDVLHVQGLGFPREVLGLAALAPGTPIVLQHRAERLPRHPGRWPLWRRGFSAARGLMFCAREQARPFRYSGLLPARTRLYELAGSSCRFVPQDQAEARRITGITGAPALLWVGHLNRNKDPLTVLAGLSVAARRLPDLQLWCCFGHAPLAHAIRERIRLDPLLRGRVHLLGTVPHEQVEQLMSAADFLVQGSRFESTGYTVIEALACGLPPLVTDIPSFRALAGGVAGRLWPCGDAPRLCEALLQMAAQPQGPLRAAARERFEQQLSLEALGRKLAAAYRDLQRS